MKTYFAEEQKYRQAWLWFIIVPLVAGTIIYFASGMNQQLIHGEDFGDKPMSDTGLIIVGVSSMIIMILVAAMFYYTRMILIITSDSIRIKYPPIMSKEKVFHREEISSYEVRIYKPIAEFGGWGVKTGNKKNGKAYNVRGNLGLQIFLKNGEKVMFGTQRKDAIEYAMKKMMDSGNAL